jgi:hypothetical protein
MTIERYYLTSNGRFDEEGLLELLIPAEETSEYFFCERECAHYFLKEIGKSEVTKLNNLLKEDPIQIDGDQDDALRDWLKSHDYEDHIEDTFFGYEDGEGYIDANNKDGIFFDWNKKEFFFVEEHECNFIRGYSYFDIDYHWKTRLLNEDAVKLEVNADTIQNFNANNIYKVITIDDKPVQETYLLEKHSRFQYPEGEIIDQKKMKQYINQ